MRARDEAGVAVVLVLALTGGLLVIAGAAVGLGAVVVEHRRAQAAADLAALAAAQELQSGPDACGVARRIASANGADLDTCDVIGAEVAVVVKVELPVTLGGRAVLARARAGPARTPAGGD